MRLDHIQVKGFRNLDLEIELHPDFNIICGANGEGKTNFLEALYCLSWGKGFRSQNKEVLIAWQQQQSWMLLDFLREKKYSETLKFHMDHDKKTWSYLAKTYLRSGPIRKFFKLLTFTPDHTTLFRASPSTRRKYFDQAIANIQGTYSSCLSKYERCLRQRNALLKDMRIGGIRTSQRSVFHSFTEQLAELAIHLDQMRRDYLLKIQGFFNQRYQSIGDFGHSLKISYSSEQTSVNDYLLTFEKLEEEELQRQTTLIGPHREDFLLQMDGIVASERASQGQHRLLVIALLLAQLDLIQELNLPNPIFILDDLGSELDQQRLNYLAAEVYQAQCQCFLTTTRSDYFLDQNLKQFQIQAGKIQA